MDKIPSCQFFAFVAYLCWSFQLGTLRSLLVFRSIIDRCVFCLSTFLSFYKRRNRHTTALYCYARPHRAEALSDGARLTSGVCLSDVCLSRTSGLSREQRPRDTKIGIEVAHITRDSDTTFKIRRSKVNLFDGQKGIAWPIFCCTLLCFDSVSTNLVK